MPQKEPKKYALIIGGTGFISQYCVDELHKAGFIVATMNRGSSIDLHGDKVFHRFIVNCRKRELFRSALKSSILELKNIFLLNNLSYQMSGNVDEIVPENELPDAWDLVIDFICYEPPHAEDCTIGLDNLCKLFIMISTDSIYEVCKRPKYLEEKKSEQQLQRGDMHTIRHPGRREEDHELLNVSEKELRRKDEYGLEKLQCEDIFKGFAEKSRINFEHFQQNFLQNDNNNSNSNRNNNNSNKIENAQQFIPFETVFLRLPDVTGERELPRNRHFQLQMRIQLGLPIYIDPESNKYNVDEFNLHTFYDEKNNQQNNEQNNEQNNRIINILPKESEFPADSIKLSFVHARDVSTAIIACFKLQQLALEQNVDGKKKSWGNSWEVVKNTGLNIGSLEQVTLLEYLYLIGNTLNKPVFVYSSSESREKLFKQRLIDFLQIQASESNCEGKLQNDVTIFNNRIYPRSYHELYLEYITNNSLRNRSDDIQGLEQGRLDMTFFSKKNQNNIDKAPTDRFQTPEKLLHTLNFNNICPVEYDQLPNQHNCINCETYLPSSQFLRRFGHLSQPIPQNSQLSDSPQTPPQKYPNQLGAKEWYEYEKIQQFLSGLFSAGYSCPLSDSSSDSSGSEEESSADDSDYDDFFTGNFAKEFISPIIKDINMVENIDTSKLTKKGRIAAVVKMALRNDDSAPNSSQNAQFSAKCLTSTPFSHANLSHLKVLHLLERLEAADQCTYLPSVTQGPISIQKALDHLPDWSPMCLYAWASKQTLWYNTPMLMNAMDADPRNALWKIDLKWGNYFE
jgi:hypothetical protein